MVPADLGRVLALDPAPEVKTLRCRLAELCGLKLGSQLVQRLARRHADRRQEAMGYVSIDHVRVYHGKRALPKVHGTRWRIAMPDRFQGPAELTGMHGQPMRPGSATPTEIRSWW